MTAIAPQSTDLPDVQPKYFAFRTRRGGIWLGAEAVDSGISKDGTGESHRGRLCQPAETAVSDMDNFQGSTSAAALLTPSSSPLTVIPSGLSTVASTGLCSTLTRCASPFGSRPATPVPSAVLPSNPQLSLAEVRVRTYCGRVLRRPVTEVIPISEREYRRLVFREYSIARKAYAFKRDALLRRRVDLLQQLNSPAATATCMTPMHPESSPSSSHAPVQEAFTAARGGTTLSGGQSSGTPNGLAPRPCLNPSPAVMSVAAAYAYRVTRRIDGLQGHDIVISSSGREIVVRHEADIDEQWHGDCDAEVVDPWLASRHSAGPDVYEPMLQRVDAESDDSEHASEWSFLHTSRDSSRVASSSANVLEHSADGMSPTKASVDSDDDEHTALVGSVLRPPTECVIDPTMGTTIDTITDTITDMLVDQTRTTTVAAASRFPFPDSTAYSSPGSSGGRASGTYLGALLSSPFSIL